jgi:hypothetical protein
VALVNTARNLSRNAESTVPLSEVS